MSLTIIRVSRFYKQFQIFLFAFKTKLPHCNFNFLFFVLKGSPWHIDIMSSPGFTPLGESSRLVPAKSPAVFEVGPIMQKTPAIRMLNANQLFLVIRRYCRLLDLRSIEQILLQLSLLPARARSMPGSPKRRQMVPCESNSYRKKLAHILLKHQLVEQS